jgi:hypothetical protein
MPDHQPGRGELHRRIGPELIRAHLQSPATRLHDRRPLTANRVRQQFKITGLESVIAFE